MVLKNIKKLSLQEEKKIWEERYEKAKHDFFTEQSETNLSALSTLMHNLNVIDKKIYGIF